MNYFEKFIVFHSDLIIFFLIAEYLVITFVKLLRVGYWVSEVLDSEDIFFFDFKFY